MSFRIKKRENTNFNTPQEMYSDYKKRTISGPLDYQSDMIDLYMKNGYDKKDVALELPTGSGKTLIGLLIGEYRRRKNKEKVIFLCPTNQLVNQVVSKAKNEYGIKVFGFTGKFKEYDPEAKAEFNRGQAMAVTNYSSFFNNKTFFSDVDIIIMDDAHSAENYIASSWSMSISRFDDKELYLNIIEILKDVIDITHYNRMSNDYPMSEDSTWFDKLPNITMLGKLNEVATIIDAYVTDSNLKYAWANIKNHLFACNIFLSWNEILIRPYIPPTLTHSPFNSSTQRIYMSATLGESGELERITGIDNIYRLPMVHDWDKKSIGRRFFLFPGASLKSIEINEFLLGINQIVERSLFLVKDDKSVNKISDFFKDNSETDIFNSKDIEISKDAFVNSKNGIAILANRYDGIDLADDDCRMLFIWNQPNATHLQEKFLTSRMVASVLFNERIKTRIVQAIGRCTRTPVDYAAVCILGGDLENSLISPKKLEEYHPELQAELDFGYDQSISHDIQSFLKTVKLFFERGEAWEEAEEEIINRRDEFIQESTSREKNKSYEILLKSAKHEVKFQYALWKQDFDEALNQIEYITSLLTLDELKGYKGFWMYMAGYISYQLYLNGKKTYLDVSREYLKSASLTTNSITWFNKLIDANDEIENKYTYMSDIIERIEEQILIDGTKNNHKFEKRAKKILDLLNSEEGLKFEQGHFELGILLGYISNNATGDAEPDPWWIVNDEICIVSEDKIYQNNTKSIPVRHVKQADGHINWIKDKVNTLKPNAQIETIFITNSDYIESSAVIHAKNLWYVNKIEFINWARKAIEGVRKIRRNFIEQGNLLWRQEAEDIFKELYITPLDFLNFIQKQKLDKIKVK